MQDHRSRTNILVEAHSNLKTCSQPVADNRIRSGVRSRIVERPCPGKLLSPSVHFGAMKFELGMRY